MDNILSLHIHRDVYIYIYIYMQVDIHRDKICIDIQVCLYTYIFNTHAYACRHVYKLIDVHIYVDVPVCAKRRF